MRINLIIKDWKGFRFTKCNKKRGSQFCPSIAKTVNVFLDIQFWVDYNIRKIIVQMMVLLDKTRGDLFYSLYLFRDMSRFDPN